MVTVEANFQTKLLTNWFVKESFSLLIWNLSNVLVVYSYILTKAVGFYYLSPFTGGIVRKPTNTNLVIPRLKNSLKGHNCVETNSDFKMFSFNLV